MSGTAPYVLALDEGSSSARSVVVDSTGAIVGEARAAVEWSRPRPGWVELDPRYLWRTQLDTVHRVMAQTGVHASDLAAVAVTSHRETVMIWDRRTGEPVHDAVVWISHQTDDIVRRWQAAGLDAEFRRRTGLRNDSFFSAAKVAWLLAEVPGVRERAEAGELACGTVDTWLVWNLTGGRVHRTDHSCASRTALFDLENLRWDTELCAMLGIPTSLLAETVASDDDFGKTDPSVLGLPVPIRGVLADQQAGMYGQACFGAGSAKNTFGTAGVLTVNSGVRPQLVDGLTSSVGWTVGGRTAYELEGVVFHSGQTLQWLRDNLRLFDDATDIETLASSVPDAGGVYLVPAFGGMCAPHWDRQARASVVGLTLETNHAHLVRAALEAMAFQTCDVITELDRGGVPVTELKVDGGAARNDLLCQFLADISGRVIRRPRALERTALGVAYVAGLATGVWSSADEIERSWSCDREFEPRMSPDERAARRSGWQEAVDRTLPSRFDPALRGA
ncbi:FGGY family carbohydrate kinase [Nakamurella endophytica]|uniref:ATP:glycerol 3-phosphotransferase n=1 Tax=Nakamurella endophytica TaxID=1748367 RepID=A0A917SZP5_9ACTN|nr:glycerol kinase GlpK [Nakamurella endophytica]GGM05156.1 glycerol kinase [Nakamurella endophytica]